jgi:hypothetical protein
MKKSLLAAALCGAFTMSAHAQSSVTLYGLIDAGFVYTNNQQGHANYQLGSSSTQNTVFGLKGSEDLGAGLHAIFKLEQGFLLNNGAQAFAGSAFGSQAWVGLQSDAYGTVTLGRQFDVMNDLVGPLTAEFNTWGGSIAAHPFENDNLAANSVVINNSVKYASPVYHGVTFETMYSFSNQAGAFADNRSYGFGLSYAMGPVNLAAGYLQLNNAGSERELHRRTSAYLVAGRELHVRPGYGRPRVEPLADRQRVGRVLVRHGHLPRFERHVVGHAGRLAASRQLRSEREVRADAGPERVGCVHVHAWRVQRFVAGLEHGNAADGLLGQQAHRLLPGRRLSERARRAGGFGAVARHAQHAVAVGNEFAGCCDGGYASRVLSRLALRA